jgi:hypothetical protein
MWTAILAYLVGKSQIGRRLYVRSRWLQLAALGVSRIGDYISLTPPKLLSF